MPSLPTRAELALHYSAFERDETRREAIASVLFIAALFGNLPLMHWLEPYGLGWILMPLLVAEMAAALAARGIAKRRAHAAGVGCPSCGAVFMRKEARQVVVATGNCVECAAPICGDAADARGAGISEVASHRADSASSTRGPLLILVAALGIAAYGMTATRDQAGLPRAHGVTVEEAAARIEASRGRPSVVLLYGTRCQPKCRVLADFAAMVRRHPDVDVLAFSVDERSAYLLPALLWRHDANFPAVYLRKWPAGSLGRAMAPLGIHIGTIWTPHLIAVRDADGRVVAQGQGVQDVEPYEEELERLSNTGVP